MRTSLLATAMATCLQTSAIPVVDSHLEQIMIPMRSSEPLNDELLGVKPPNDQAQRRWGRGAAECGLPRWPQRPLKPLVRRLDSYHMTSSVATASHSTRASN